MLLLCMERGTRRFPVTCMLLQGFLQAAHLSGLAMDQHHMGGLQGVQELRGLGEVGMGREGYGIHLHAERHLRVQVW